MKHITRLGLLLMLGAVATSLYGCSGQQESKTIPYNDGATSGKADASGGPGAPKKKGLIMPGP